MSETTESVAQATEDETTRKRRRLRPGEVAMLRQFLNLTEPGNSIRFDDLPNTDMKRALFQSSPLRLVQKELLVVEQDDTGRIVSVSVDAEMLDEYKWDLAAPEPKVVRQRDTDESKQRKPRGKLNDEKYCILKIAKDNPRREKTHAWYNWKLCYWDGQTIPQYLTYMDYDRNIRVTTKFGESWFNGPETFYLYQDFKAGYIGIYDSTKQESDSDYWLKASEVFKEDIESEESSDTEESNGDSSVASETAEAPAG